MAHLRSPNPMNIFDKANGYTLPEEGKARGVYPYFQAIQEATATEARIDDHWKIMVGSNNYLGLTHHPRVLEAAANAMRRYGSGATGSRFLNGTLDMHEQLEDRFAKLFRKEAALVFTTGYQASLGVIATLAGRGDHLFLDRLDHASLVDAARLGYAEVHRYPHGDFAALDRQLSAAPEHAAKLVVTDGVFSMEGTVVDLPGLVKVAQEHDAQILVDEAHALGVMGEHGAGTVEHFHLERETDLVLATFSKSLASVGGVVAGPAKALNWIRHHARALIFTASMPPASLAGVLAALDVMRDEPERRERLWKNTRAVSEGLRSLGFDLGGSETPIIPVLIGDMWKTVGFWRLLFDNGIFTHPIVPPAVPPDRCRIRVSMSAEHSDEQVERVIEAFAKSVKQAEALPV
jgi:8-amino-7-oxononanoate synthase